jgi:SAM-dependent MidA family methyltransferase
MALDGYPLDTFTKRHLEAGLGSRKVGRLIAYLLNRSGERAVQKVVAGDVAGPITVTGIATNDRLVSVLFQDGTSKMISDLTSEFSISAANTITNLGGTATTGGVLIVAYGDRT